MALRYVIDGFALVATRLGLFPRPDAFEALVAQLPLGEDVTQARALMLRASATSPGLKTHRART